MLYVSALCYVALVFLRLSEVIPGWHGLRLVLAASVIVAPMLAVAWWRRGPPLDLPHDRWLLGYWLAIGLSSVAAGWPGEAVLGLEQFAHVAFLYFLLRTAITRPEQLRMLVVVLTAAMVFHAIGAIVQHQTGVGWGKVTPFIERGAPRSRSVGIFNDPNDLALGFLIVLPFLVAGVLGRDRTRRQRAAAGLIAAPILLAFYYSNSRGGMIGLAVSVSVYSWRRLGSRAGTLVAAVALALLIALAPSRLGMLMNLDEVSAQGRIQAWTAGLDMLKAHPLTGVGWGGYLRLHARSAHNSFLHAFGELGLIGGFCFVAIAYSYFWGLRWRPRRDDPAVASLSNWEDALYSAGAGFFVDAFFLSQQYGVMTFSVVALGAVYVSIAKKAGPVVFGRRQWLSVAGATAAILGVIWLGVRLLVVRGG